MTVPDLGPIVPATTAVPSLLTAPEPVTAPDSVTCRFGVNPPNVTMTVPPWGEELLSRDIVALKGRASANAVAGVSSLVSTEPALAVTAGACGAWGRRVQNAGTLAEPYRYNYERGSLTRLNWGRTNVSGRVGAGPAVYAITGGIHER